VERAALALLPGLAPSLPSAPAGVEVGVGPRHQLLGAPLRPDLGHPDLEAVAGAVPKVVLDLSQDAEGALRSGVGEGDHELVPSPAHDEVVAAKPPGESPRQLAQEGVAGGMAAAVVDGLERVQVDEGDREQVVTVAARAADLAIQGGQAGAAPQGAGQVVHVGGLLERTKAGADQVRQVGGKARQTLRRDAELTGQASEQRLIVRASPPFCHHTLPDHGSQQTLRHPPSAEPTHP